jgi:hypothetical protein
MKANRRAQKTVERPSFSTEELLKDTHTKKALEKLTRKGLPWEKALTLLQLIPHASNKTVPIVEGMEPRVLLSLPDRINRIAREISTVNGSPTLGPKYMTERPDLFTSTSKPLDGIYPGAGAQVAAQLFSMIPSLLDHYARHLRERLRINYHRASTKRIFLLRMQTLHTLQLLKLVRTTTGGYHYEEVATLLEAAYRACGRAKTISDDDLKKLVTNHPNLRALAAVQLIVD